MFKCEDDPYEMCPAGNGTSKPCCGLQQTTETKFSCTEMRDAIMVQHAKTSNEYFMFASIGCACIKEHPVKANEPFTHIFV